MKTNYEIRYAAHPEDAKHYDTARIRRDFLIEKVFSDNEVNIVYFWSVGCLKGKSESFRLRFVLFAIIRSADFPLFPSSPACSNPILGQKWVKFSRLH